MTALTTAPSVPQTTAGRGRAAAIGEFAVPIAVLAIVLALIAPVPPLLLDLLLVADITMSVIVMMVAMYITRPVDFNVFPTTLLLLTLFRLALNVSSSRLILLNGHTGSSAAGDVIQAFGNFAVGGSYIVGTVIFLVLIAIQYVVINHGAVRISEVTARFTLDGLPGKQMSIDADLNAGMIDEAEARRRRKALAAEAEFYGAMDGASKFTQRDAVAGILITGINIMAGLAIGVIQHGADITKALESYTVLTIGDGLVTVIPALMISISGGMIVTRATSDNRLGTEFQKQIFGASQPLAFSSGILIVLALLPGLPTVPFLILGVLIGGVAWKLKNKPPAAADVTLAAPPSAPRDTLEDLLRVEPLAIEVGVSLVSFIAGNANSPLMRRIAAIRRQLAGELGFVVPPVRVNDSLGGLRAREYSISLKGIEIARFELVQGCDLAIALTATDAPPDGFAAKDPVFGVDAWWVPSESAEKLRSSGYTTIDPLSVLVTHFAELVRRYAHEVFTRQEAKKVLDRIAMDQPKVVEDLVPKLLSLANVQKVFQNLLRERVSVRDAASVLEALGEAAPATRNPVLLTDYVRQSIRRTIVQPFLNGRGDLAAWFVDPQLERMVESGIEQGETISTLALPPAALRDLTERFQRSLGQPDSPVPVVVSSASRYFLRQALENVFPHVFFLSHNEIPAGVRVQSLGSVQ